MTGFALGDKFIGVSTDNIYTKQELDTKLQDKQDTLTAGQGININEDGTISANTNLDVSNPLELAYPQLPNHGISLNDDGSFTRVEAALNSYTIPYNGNSSASRKIDFLASNLSGQNNNTIPINNYDGAYSQWEAEGTIIHELLSSYAQGGSSIQDCFVFGTLEDNIFTMKAKLGFYPAGASLGSLADTFTQGTWSSKTFTPTSPTSGGTGDYQYGHTGKDYYMKFGLNEGGNYAITIFDKATNTLQVHNEYTKGNFKTVLESCNCVLLPFGYNAGGSATEKLSYDTEYNKVLSSTGTELWTATIPNTSVTPTLQLNYDSTLTLNGDNLGVNTSNLGLATVATTGSYTDLTNTPEEYVLPTASTDTLGGVKVDGTSIVIAEGVISTNTGTEVDTYTKTEIDSKLDEKQDVLNPAAPLSIEAVQINPSNNMTVLDTGDIVSSNEAWVNNPNSDKTTFNYNAGSEDGVYTFVQNASFDYVQKQLGCMVFPFTYGNIYTVPLCSNTARDTFQPPAIALGYYDADATFIPVFTTTLSADEWALFTNTTAIETQPVWDVWGFVSSSEGVYTNREGLGQPSSPWIPKYYTMYFQIFKKTDGNYSFTNVTHYSNHLTSYKGDFNSTMNEYLNKCTHIMLCAWSTNDAGIGVNNGIGAPAYNLSNNTYNFAYSGNLAEDIEADTFNYDNLVATSENLFKFEVINNTVLALNIDNNTIKVNENNQLYADIDTTAAVATADTAGIVRPTGDVLSVNAEGGLSADTYNTSTLDTKFEEKQDTLTATNGISIERKTISNVEGFSYTSDSSAIYNTGGWGVGAPLGQNWTVYQVPGIADLVGTSMTATTFPNRIVMPYTFGQIVKYPSIYAYRPINIAFGKLAEDGTFYPIWFPGNNRYYYKSDDNIIQKSGNFEQIHFYSYADWGQSPENDKTDVFTYNNSVQYMQLKVTDSDLKLNYTYGVSNHSYMRQYYKTDVSILNRFKEVNAIMIIPYYQIYSASSEIIGVNIDSAIPVTSIGLYTNTMDLYDSAEQLDGYDFGENLFDIGGVQAHNYISINTDNSTIKVNGSGQLYANIELPDNVITSDNISTNAYIQQLEQRITALESLIDGGNSLGEIITNTVIQTAGTPAGGQNSGYVGTQTITVKDLETS